MKQLILTLFFFSFLLLIPQGCVLYPKYERPCMEMPGDWRVSSDEASTVANARWWEEFRDPILNELIEEALESNNDLRVAAARIDEFRAQFGIARSELYPQINLQESISRQRFSQTFPAFASTFGAAAQGGAGTTTTPTTTAFSPYISDYLVLVTASYELDLFGKNRSATYAAYTDYLASIEARRFVILTVVTSVAASYMQLRQFDLQWKVSQQTAKSRKQSLDLAIVRFKEGMTSELEVKQAASEYDQALLQVIQYQTMVPQQENLISVLIGHPPKAIERGRQVYEWPLPPDIPAGLPADLLEQRPDIVEAEERLMAANYRIGEARAQFFPDITLTGNYGYQSSQLHELFLNPSRTWLLMANLMQPLFTGWRLTNQVELAIAQTDEALYNYLQTVLIALQQVNDALIAHKNARESFKVEEDNVKVLKDYLHLANLQYENGLVDYLNVLDAERRLFDAQLQLAQIQTSVFITLISVYKSLGGGWVIDAENLMKE